MASTYPLEVVGADRWMNQNKDLKGDALKAAAEKQDWDESVKALVATASVLQMMNEQLEWTQKARRGVFGTATGRDGRCAAVALKGLRQEEAGHDERAEGDGKGGAEPTGHLH
jgi:Protein of unknown function (DUF3300)